MSYNFWVAPLEFSSHKGMLIVICNKIMSDDDSSKKIASSKDFETTTNTEDVTNADLLSLFKTYMNENIDGIQRNCDDKTHSLAKVV
jgi:hypothetical protein